VKVRGCLAWPDRAVATCSTEQSPRPSLIESAVILDLLTLIILFGQLSCIRPQQIGRRVQIHCRLGPLCRRPLRIELPCTYRAKQIDNNNNNNNNRVQRSITDQPVHHYLQLRPTIFITRSTLRMATWYFGSGSVRLVRSYCSGPPLNKSCWSTNRPVSYSAGPYDLQYRLYIGQAY
jgi:hypothetical protein